MTKGVAIKYSQEELAWIKENCKLPRDEAHRKFCNEFSRKDISLEAYKALCNRKKWLTGRSGFFSKGATPHNKGKEMAYNANNARTQFKAGNSPHNTKYVGHERISKDGYTEINIGNAKYALKHRFLWEQENGKLPKHMCLKCIDGNRLNTNPANWEAIPRGALPFLNGKFGFEYDKIADELKPSVLALAKVRCAKAKIVRAAPERLT